MSGNCNLFSFSSSLFALSQPNCTLLIFIFIFLFKWFCTQTQGPQTRNAKKKNGRFEREKRVIERTHKTVITIALLNVFRVWTVLMEKETAVFGCNSTFAININIVIVIAHRVHFSCIANYYYLLPDLFYCNFHRLQIKININSTSTHKHCSVGSASPIMLLGAVIAVCYFI